MGKLLAMRMGQGGSGKIFVVGNVGLIGRTKWQEIFSTDPDGKILFSASIAGALAQCNADVGDTIYLLPGHTETVIAAGTINVNVAGVSIIGLGVGNDAAIITSTTAIAASFNVTAANTVIRNVIFTCGIDAQTSMINVSAADVLFDSCTFNTNSATIGTVLGILTAATSDRFAVKNCRFIGPATNSGTTTTAQIQYEAAVDIQIVNSYFTGKMTQAVLNTATVLRGLIDNNRMVVATGTKAIAVAAASTPFISNNRINVPSGTAPIVAAAGFVAGNVYSAAAGVTAGTAATI